MSRAVLLLVVAMCALPLLTGCGGGFAPGDPDYPEETRLTLALRAQDPDGNPIANARVYVDGDRDDWLTEEAFEPLDTEFPQQWRGWLANWVDNTRAIFDPTPGEPIHFDIAVRKTGWGEGVTVVHIASASARHYYARDTITLYPGGADGNPAVEYAEVFPAP